MEISGENGDKRIVLTSGDEVALVRFATQMHKGHLRRHSFLGRNRQVTRELSDVTAQLGEALSQGHRLRQPSSERPPIELSVKQSALAVGALRWVIENRDFDPEQTTGEMRELVSQIDMADATSTVS